MIVSDRRRIIEWVTPRLNLPSSTTLIPMFMEGETIPRIIHQTFATKDLHPLIEKNVAQIRSSNPNWEYRFYTDQDVVNFVRVEYGDRILEYFNRINPMYGPARADLFRYLLMYKIGGVYQTSRVQPQGHLMRFCRQGIATCSHNGRRTAKGRFIKAGGIHPELRQIKGGEYQNWHIIVAPGHPFLRAVISNVLRNIDIYYPFHGVGKLGVLNLTGPVSYTLAIHPLLGFHKHRFVRSTTELGLDYTIFSGSWRSRNSHLSLFKRHYTQLKQPIVEIGPLKKLINALYIYLNFDFGLAYYFLRNYEKSLSFVHHAYEQGYALPWLKERLQELGWADW